MRIEKYNILVTGGASFIGSHLVDALVARGAAVRVVDDLSCGDRANIDGHIASGKIEFIKGNLLDPAAAKRAVRGADVVVHLAACHGGRGYVNSCQADCSTNMMLDGNVFAAARAARIKKLVFASSGCVYPNFRQMNVRKKIYLSERMAGPPYDADNMYGWAKLMSEFTLKAYYKEYGMDSVSLRYFTVYGPRAVESHAVMAIIARAFVKADPFEVWGDGSQVRNWTYVGDIVSGTIRAAERSGGAVSINLGTMERIKVSDVVKEAVRYAGYDPEVKFLPQMPVGPLNRVADNKLARKLLGWQPRNKFRDDFRRTIKWYFGAKDAATVRKTLKSRLFGTRCRSA